MRTEIGFLGIGAHKSGTTWLSEQLRRHPGIWMPPMKEIHYFDRSARYPSPTFLDTPHFVERLRQRSPTGGRQFRKRFRAAIWRAVRKGSASELRWVLRFYLGTYDDDWYCSLFEQGRGRMAGEITPAYSMLDAEDIARVQKLFPMLKILLLIRNPIDRAWSQIRFAWTHEYFKDVGDPVKVEEFVDSPRQELRGDYLRMLELWSSYFPRKQIFVGFYDDVMQRPQALLSDVFRFLAVDDLKLEQSHLEERHNISDSLTFPSQTRLHLAQKYLPELRRLSEQLGGHATTWLREAEQLIESRGEPTTSPPPPIASV